MYALDFFAATASAAATSTFATLAKSSGCNLLRCLFRLPIQVPEIVTTHNNLFFWRTYNLREATKNILNEWLGRKGVAGEDWTMDI